MFCCLHFDFIFGENLGNLFKNFINKSFSSTKSFKNKLKIQLNLKQIFCFEKGREKKEVLGRERNNLGDDVDGGIRIPRSSIFMKNIPNEF